MSQRAGRVGRSAQSRARHARREESFMKTLIARSSAFVATMALAIAAAEASVSATVAPGVPEIDGSTLSAAMGVLAGGILILRSRRRSK
jgi:hypothetical protein